MNEDCAEKGMGFQLFPGKIETLLRSTIIGCFQQADKCTCAVEKTVETVNNILYMQIYQKKLTNYIAGSIIVSESSKCWGNIC